MNILLINHYAGSLEMGMEFRPYYFAREWIKAGHKVDIIAGDYSHLRKKNPTVEMDFQEEIIDEITYHWVRTGSYEGNGVKRALTMAKFVTKLWGHARNIVKKIQPDVVISSSTYPIDTFAAQKIAKKAKAKLIHEVHDMWPATLIEVGGMSKWNPFVIAMQIGENSAYKHSDRVVSLLPCAKDYMMQHGMKEEKFCHISNGIVLGDWENPQELPQEHKDILEKYRSEKKFIVGYFGGHALSNKLDLLIEVANAMKDRNEVQFVLVGEGLEKGRLQQRATDYELKNISFLSSIPKLCIPRLLEMFDCIYVALSDSPLYRFGTAMNKTYDSMMSGKPLLYAVNAPNNYVLEYQCGVNAENVNVDSICKALEQLMDMPADERIWMGKNGRKAVVENYSYTVLAEKFCEIMK